VTETAVHRPRRGCPRAAIAALAVVLGVSSLLAALYATRRQIAREAVSDWLKSRGVASETQFETLGPGHLAGRIRIGPAARPDLDAPRVEASYSLISLLRGRGVQLTSVRLSGPTLSLHWRSGRLSAGALDPLIADLRAHPPQSRGPSPRIEIDRARLIVDSDYGDFDATVDAAAAEGRLERLAAEWAPARLRWNGAEAELGRGRLEARVREGRVSLTSRTSFARLAARDAELRGGEVALEVQAPYPDPAQAKPLVGDARLSLRATAARAGAAASGPIEATLQASDLTWTPGAGGRLAGRLRLDAGAERISAAALRLSPTVSAAGDFALGGVRVLRLAGSARAAGGWSGLGAPVKGDSPQIAALKRGLLAFRAVADGFVVQADRRGLSARLTGAARLIPAAGGEIRLTPVGAGYRLTSTGGGLPLAAADIRRLTYAQGRASAEGHAQAALSVGPLQDAKVDAQGTLRLAGGVASFEAARCAEVSAARLDLGKNDVKGLSGRLCPAGAPMVRIGNNGWELAGRAEDAAATVPFLQDSVTKGAGEVRLADERGRLRAHASIAGAELRDLAPTERFRPVILSGQADLAQDLWTGEFEVRLPSGAHVAHASLRQEALKGAGQLELATGPLRFAAGGLQPADLSEAAKSFGEEVTGAAAFTGGFRWTADSLTSEGDLKIDRLDLKSPVGAASGVSGELHFSSLAPLIAPPGQVLRAERLGAAVPLTDLSASLALEEKALVVARGSAAAEGGRLRLEGLEAPFSPDQPVRGVLLAEGVRLRDLVKASPFGDRVALDTTVSGRIPFEVQGGKVRVTRGDLHAVAPGRLSISRAALSPVPAGGPAPGQGDGAAATDDTFTDFAYQALENLAFDTLDARLNTQPDGRLGVLFHIVGRHDPPERQEITISWFDLIRRRFAGRKLPLPSDTAVDLTLDTTLNLDELLGDYGDFERLRGGSPPVQKGPARPPA
jgi:hypothetical protein